MNTSLSIAFLAGLISFLSPCVLPLIPGYISYIAGASFENLVQKNRNLIILKTVFFTLGFSLVFIILGSTASIIGKFLLINSNICDKSVIIDCVESVESNIVLQVIHDREAVSIPNCLLRQGPFV